MTLRAHQGLLGGLTGGYGGPSGLMWVPRLAPLKNRGLVRGPAQEASQSLGAPTAHDLGLLCPRLFSGILFFLFCKNAGGRLLRLWTHHRALVFFNPPFWFLVSCYCISLSPKKVYTFFPGVTQQPSVSIMSYFGVQRPVILGYLAFQILRGDPGSSEYSTCTCVLDLGFWHLGWVRHHRPWVHFGRLLLIYDSCAVSVLV